MVRILEEGYFHRMIGHVILVERERGRVFIGFDDEYHSRAWFSLRKIEYIEE